MGLGAGAGGLGEGGGREGGAQPGGRGRVEEAGGVTPGGGGAGAGGRLGGRDHSWGEGGDLVLEGSLLTLEFPDGESCLQLARGHSTVEIPQVRRALKERAQHLR